MHQFRCNNIGFRSQRMLSSYYLVTWKILLHRNAQTLVSDAWGKQLACRFHFWHKDKLPVVSYPVHILFSAGVIPSLFVNSILLGPGARFSKVPKTFRARKAIRKTVTANSVNPVFSYDIKGIKIKINAKFRASRRLRFEDAKRIMSPEMCPKSFGTFEKQAPVVHLGPENYAHD